MIIFNTLNIYIIDSLPIHIPLDPFSLNFIINSYDKYQTIHITHRIP